jgi:multidrug resistance efflux pump
MAASIERGAPVAQGAELIRISSTETDAQLKEAEANAAQIEARLGITGGAAMDINAVPEVQNAKAGADLAQAEFARIKSLLDQRVVSQSEYDQRRTQAEAARQQYEAAKNGAAQQYQMLQAARARVALARKAFSDTSVRAPFNGVVAQRLVTTGDYVTKGMKVATIVRVNPLRVQLTVPEQAVSRSGSGRWTSRTLREPSARSRLGSVTLSTCGWTSACARPRRMGTARSSMMRAALISTRWSAIRFGNMNLSGEFAR